MKKDKIQVGFLVVFLVFIAFVIFFNIKKGNNESMRLESEYPLVRMENRIEGQVIFKYDFLSNRLRDFLVVSMLKVDDSKCTIIANEIEGSNDYGINELVSVGDSIFKEKDNDTITIKKSDTGKIYTLLRRDKLY